jgi:hypothetical protein
VREPASGCLETSQSGIPVHAAKNAAANGVFSQNQYIVPFFRVVLAFPIGPLG